MNVMKRKPLPRSSRRRTASMMQSGVALTSASSSSPLAAESPAGRYAWVRDDAASDENISKACDFFLQWSRGNEDDVAEREAKCRDGALDDPLCSDGADGADVDDFRSSAGHAAHDGVGGVVDGSSNRKEAPNAHGNEGGFGLRRSRTPPTPAVSLSRKTSRGSIFGGGVGSRSRSAQNLLQLDNTRGEVAEDAFHGSALAAGTQQPARLQKQIVESNRSGRPPHAQDSGANREATAAEILSGRLVPSVVVRRLAELVLQPVVKVRYAQRFVLDVIDTMRSLGSSIVYIALFILVIVWLARLDLVSRFSTFRNGATPSRPWMNFCTGGVVNGSCHFETRTILDSVSALEASQFFHKEFVTDLWHCARDAALAKLPETANASQISHAAFSARAGDVLYEGAWLVGALLMRLAASDTSSNDGGGSGLIPCTANNVSVAISEPFLSAVFDCRSYLSTTIPFSATFEEAMTLTEAFVAEVPEWAVTSTVLQYAMYNPSNDNFAWVTASLGIPRYGGVVPRIATVVLDRTLHTLIRTCMWCSLVLVGFDLVIFLALIRHKEGIARAAFNLFLRFALFGFVVGSVVLLRDVPDQIDGIFQTDFVVNGLDTAVAASQNAEMLFALWMFAIIAIIAQFLGYLDGLRQVAKLIGIILPELLGLFFVFGFFYIAFLMVAMMAFGATVDAYASFFNANAALIKYFFVQFDLSSFESNYPQTGFAFYYVFRCFLLFVVTNFCIVTIIAPIKSVWIEGDLPFVVSRMIVQKHRNALRRGFERVKQLTLSVVVFFVNSTPVYLSHWVRYSALLDKLYDVSTPFHDRVAAGHRLISAQEECRRDRQSRFVSDFLKVTRSTRAAEYPSSFVLCLLGIQVESKIGWLRDARLLHMLLSFDEFSTKMEKHLFDAGNGEDDEQVSPIVDLPPELQSDDDEDDDDKVSGESSSNSNAPPKQQRSPKAEVGQLSVTLASRHKDVHDPSASFHFTEYMLRELTEYDFFADFLFVTFTALDRIAIVVMYVLMLMTVISTPRDVSYFTRNVHSGIRDLPMRQSCLDEQCTQADTIPWTFTDLRTLDDLREFVRRRLVRSLYRNSANPEEELPNLSGYSDLDVVAWDSHIIRFKKVVVRQIRGVPVPCSAPDVTRTLSTSETARKYYMASTTTCSSSTAYDTSPMTRPPNTILSPGAYQWSASCAEVGGLSVHGFYNLHWPCSGYSAEISNATQLIYAIDEWIDDKTRLASIHMEFLHAGKGVNASSLVLAYDLYAEFAQGGSSGRFFARSTPLTDPDLASINDIGIILMTADFAFGVVELVVPLLYTFIFARKRFHRKRKMSFRIVAFVVYICIATTTANSTDTWADTVAAVILVAFFTYQLLFLVMFPVAVFFFRRVGMVNDFIALAFLQVAQLFPLFFVLVTAFASAGYIMWGSRVMEFATFYESFLTVSQGLLGDFELDELYDRNSTYAMIYAFLMLVVLVILGLNLLLAVIAGCAEEARAESAIMDPVETVASMTGRSVFYGPIFRLLLSQYFNYFEAWSAAAKKRRLVKHHLTSVLLDTHQHRAATSAAADVTDRTAEEESEEVGLVGGSGPIRWMFSSCGSLGRDGSSLPLFDLEAGRLPLPSELLLMHLSPLVFHEIVDRLHVMQQPESMMCASVACILECFAEFGKSHQGKLFIDGKSEKYLTLQEMNRLLIRLKQRRRAARKAPHHQQQPLPSASSHDASMGAMPSLPQLFAATAPPTTTSSSQPFPNRTQSIVPPQTSPSPPPPPPHALAHEMGMGMASPTFRIPFSPSRNSSSSSPLVASAPSPLPSSAAAQRPSMWRQDDDDQAIIDLL